MLKEKNPVTEKSSAWWSDCLASLAVRQEQQVFLLIYDHFATKVNTYLLRLGATPAVAEELTQEAMLSVWRKSATYDRTKAAASTWIFTIARNQYIDSLRRHAVPTDLLNGDVFVDEHSDDPTQLADAAPLKRAIKALPAMQAQVLHKSYFDGLSHSEIADDLNIPLGSVKSNIRLAFQKLRARMRPES